MSAVRIASLRDTIISQIGDFLYREGFAACDITPTGILELINLLSDYEEEGKKLYPEIILTNDFRFFKTIANVEVVINEKPLIVEEFKNIVKLCAPLCSSSWIIFIELKDGAIKYGVTCAELTETTPSIYKQTVGEMKIDFGSCTIAYIRNIGSKTIELSGLKNKVLISLSLDNPKGSGEGEIQELATQITKDCIEEFREKIFGYYEKVLSEAFREGHGNLVGTIKEEAVSKLKEYIVDGIYLSIPIDIADLVIASEQTKDNETSIVLKQFGSLVKSMINHDGITIFTTSGKLVGYHIMIQDLLTSEEKSGIIGGARTRAFHSMIKSDFFEVSFIRSQDGGIKIK